MTQEYTFKRVTSRQDRLLILEYILRAEIIEEA